MCVDVDPDEGLWNLQILVDYCDGGSLNRLICDTQRIFSWKLRCSLGRDISCAMKYVHSKNIMHRDLTSMVTMFSKSPPFIFVILLFDLVYSFVLPPFLFELFPL